MTVISAIRPDTTHPWVPGFLTATVQYSLPNGLRVVLVPDRGAPVVAVAVLYDVGTRSEPFGQAGFAHLFEHLMFQGSARIPKGEYLRRIQAAGGTANGATHHDYTEYYQLLPADALEQALFMEADRMGGPAVTEENLAGEAGVIREEIRSKVDARPYGGFPGTIVSSLLFDSFHNTHDGYGSVAGLSTASVRDARCFFQKYYAPGNAVLAVSGDFEAGQAAGLVAKYFGPLPAREVEPRPSFAEPPLAGDRHTTRTDPLAPVPAFALGWRVPDPGADLAGYLPYVLLSKILADGGSSRLGRRLLAGDQVATDIGARMGPTGQPWSMRHPTCLILTCFLRPPAGLPAVRDAIDEEITRLAEAGPDPAELARTQARMAAGLLASLDGVRDRARLMGVLAQQRGDARLAGDLVRRIGEVTGEQVAAAAAGLLTGSRAVAEIVPAGSL